VRRVDPLEGYERWAATYDATSNPVVSMDGRHSLRVLSVETGELVLDAGCGTGRNLARMLEEGARPVGIDFSPAMLRSAHRRVPEVPLAAADLQSPLPFRDATFDAVLCSLVGEHLARLEFVLEELRRVLKPGGRLVFSVYHPDMAAAGVEANFEQDGIEYRLASFDYSVTDYVYAVSGAGFAPLVYREFVGDSQLAEDVPEASKYLGKPVLLVIAALAE